MKDTGIAVGFSAVVGKPNDEIHPVRRMVCQQSPERTVLGARWVIVETQRYWQTKRDFDVKMITKFGPLS